MAEQVLIVDDDQHILKALERVLRPNGYDILKADSGEKALSLMRVHDIATIICDFKMPEISGTDVLKEAIQIRPDAVRIILTGVQDMNTIVQAINVGQVSQFILKPWDEAALRQTVAGAVENFRLIRTNHQLQKKTEEQHQQLAHTHKLLSRDLEVGARIHEMLLVDNVPDHMGGFEVDAVNIPSRVIDGDFRSLLSPTDDVLDVVIGDVMGKGLPAAVVGTAVKTELTRFAMPTRQQHIFDRSHFWEQDLLSPKEVLQNVQAKLSPQLIDLGFFVSLFYARFDLRRRVLSYVDCGAPKPLHWSAAEKQLSTIEGPNFPLGTVANDELVQVDIDFGPEDMFIFYSDGLTEAQTADAELYGIDRLKKVILSNSHLPPRALLHVLQQSVMRFSEKDQFDDDLTLVGVKISGDYVPRASQVKTARFAADLSQLAPVREFVRNLCLSAPGDTEVLTAQLQLALHEAFCNVVQHGYENCVGLPIVLKGELTTDGVSMELADQGKSFNPAEMEEPSLAGDRDGGFGVYMIREIADHLAYTPSSGESGWNRLRIFKKYLRGNAMNFTHSKENSVLVITLGGDSLDAREAPQFKETVTNLIADEHAEHVVFDLQSLQFIDSSGLGSLLSVLRHVNNRGGDLKLSNMSKPIRTMFEVVRMHKLFEIFNTTNDAVSSFDN